jgi:hypothetical protein
MHSETNSLTPRTSRAPERAHTIATAQTKNNAESVRGTSLFVGTDICLSPKTLSRAYGYVRLWYELVDGSVIPDVQIWQQKHSNTCNALTPAHVVARVLI